MIQFPQKSAPDEDAADYLKDDDEDDDDVTELCDATKEFAERHVALLLHKMKARRLKAEAKKIALSVLLEKLRSEVSNQEMLNALIR